MATDILGSRLSAVTVIVVLWLVGLIAAPAGAQSLDPNKPDPLKAGVNSATADSTVGAQYWYYMADPGPHKVKVTFQSMGVLGAPMKNTLGVTLKSPLGAAEKQLTSFNGPASTEFAGSMTKTTKMVLKVDPLSPTGLVRQGGDYQVEVTGNVHFGGGAGGAAGDSNPFGSGNAAADNGDAVIRAYMCMQNDHGITKFLAGGIVSAADGSTGTWKLEDADSKAYTVTIGRDKLSLVFMPGRGLVDAVNKDVLIFKQLR
jgi:hypothetical protein